MWSKMPTSPFRPFKTIGLVTLFALTTSTSVFALEPYQAIIGTETVVVQVPTAQGGNNCSEAIADHNRYAYRIGQDVEYRLVNPSVVDRLKDGTYTGDRVCYAPKPFDGVMYGYGGPGDDEMEDHGIEPNLLLFSLDYKAWDFNQLARRGYSVNHTIYYSDGGPFTPMTISEFIRRVDAQEITLNYPEAMNKLVISPLMGRSILRGGDGNDVMRTRGGRDILYGENGNDLIDAYFDKELDYAKIVGDPSSYDEWNGGLFYGGPGDDVYYMRDSRDKFIEYPGEGFDIAFCPGWYENNPENYLGRDGYSFTYETDIEVIAGPCVTLPPNFTGKHFPKLYMLPNEVIALNGKGTSLSEAIRYYEASLTFNAGAGNDLVITGGGTDNIAGGSGDDVVITNGGNDTVTAGEGNDLVIGGSGEGNDTYNGGNGIDSVKYTSATASITVNLSAKTNQAYATAGGDAAKIGIDQLALIENVIAGKYDDTVIGSNVANRLEGDDGRDNIRGEAGNDAIVGGKGGDTFLGGSGTDIFIYKSIADSGLTADAMDTILDFAVNGEKIDLTAIDASTIVAGNNAFIFNGGAPIGTTPQGELSVAKVDNAGTANDYTMIYIDTDADLEPEAAIRVNQFPKLTIKNFVL